MMNPALGDFVNTDWPCKMCGVLDIGQEGLFAQYDSPIRRSTAVFRSLSEYPSEVIQEFPYGSASIDYTPYRRYESFFCNLPYWIVDKESSDTLIGWISINNGGLEDVPSIESYMVTTADQGFVGRYMSGQEAFARVGWNTGISTSLYANFTSATPGRIGGRAGFYAQYGVMNQGWKIAYTHLEVGYDILPTVNQLAYGPLVSGKLHFVIFDLGLSTGYYPTIDDGVYITRWEAGLSINKLAFGLYGPMTQSASDYLPGGFVTGLYCSYTISLNTPPMNGKSYSRF